MADMIDAKDAKQILGCDDATLNGHINKGQIRAQRVGGKLLLNKDDVDKLAASDPAPAEDDDGTIVLTGDSENLQIDLGKVVDDTSETIAHGKAATASNTESITFGDELEVVNFDDGKTQDLQLDDTASTQAAPTKDKAKPSLTFTDSNTAVITSVEDTVVGGTTSAVGMTSEIEAANGPASPSESSRRSVRSNRARGVETEKVGILWLVILVLTFGAGMLLGIPYYFIGISPASKPDIQGNVRRGTVDNGGWTELAGWVAGFTVEPNEETWRKNNQGGEYKSISAEVDSKAKWRTSEYQGDFKDGSRVETFDILKVEGDKASPRKGPTYTIITQPRAGATDGSTEDRVELWGAAK